METSVFNDPAPIPGSNLVRASTGKRFVNYLVDLFFFYILIFLAGMGLGYFAPEFIEKLNYDDPGLGLLDRILTLVLFALYMGTIEAMLDGKSMGKLVTGTRAYQTNGERISVAQAFGRGFSRAVPFAVFSAFGQPCDPWQDRWTDTMVVDEAESGLK